VDDDQPYFIKPGNSVLWPPTNGFGDWVAGLLRRGRKTLVMGGCTLNSCVRVSAVETQQRFGPDGLQVVVDLGLSAARAGNYVRSALFGDRSSVESAVREMAEQGVRVVPGVEWC
jgi:nicotinamidase-related amidase